jgi:hypothetical protein
MELIWNSLPVEGLPSLASFEPESGLSFAGLEPGLADSDRLVGFLELSGAVRGRDERSFEGEEDLRWFSFSFSSLFIDLRFQEMTSCQVFLPDRPIDQIIFSEV